MIKLQVHSFYMADVDDPIIYAAEPLIKWEKSPIGKWVKDNATNVTWHLIPDLLTFGHKFIITAEFNEPEALIFKLKWG